MISTSRIAAVLTAAAAALTLASGVAHADVAADPLVPHEVAKAGYAGTWTRSGASIMLRPNHSGTVNIADFSGRNNPQAWTASWSDSSRGIKITLRTRTRGTGTAARPGQVLPARVARLDNTTYLLVSNWPQRFGSGVREVAFCGPGGEPRSRVIRCGG